MQTDVEVEKDHLICAWAPEKRGKGLGWGQSKKKHPSKNSFLLMTQ